MLARGWDCVDIVLVSGDAYIDHPSFGVALIGRWLEAHGYRVAILAQPRHDSHEPFCQFGRPRLFFGITAGNLDSIVANYSGNARVREEDDYSPHGNPYFAGRKDKKSRRRPDRATIRYANLAKSAYADVPVVLGGLEASLRRFIHFDYQQNKVRASVLSDAKADLLVFGMGERAALAIARRLASGKELAGIAGTCERLTAKELRARSFPVAPEILPSWQEIKESGRQFLAAERHIDRHARSLSKAPLLQQQQSVWVLQHAPAAPLATAELDELYSLPFTRKPHPRAVDVPAYRMIRHSVTIVRGCSGNCSFCAIARHQGPVIVSRSIGSVRREVEEMTGADDFSGTVSDLGGPTANLFGSRCTKPSPCRRHDCLYPSVCRYLHVDEDEFLDLLDTISSIDRVRHVYVSSGLRMELLLRTPRLLKQLIAHHTPGAMKIAPEHTVPEILRLMHKPGAKVLAEFLHTSRAMARQAGRVLHFTPYCIAAHPGCTVQHMEALAAMLRQLDLPLRKFQDFTPTPGTISTAMYVSGLDRDTWQPIPVARGAKERRAQRLALEGAMPRARQKKGNDLPGSEQPEKKRQGQKCADDSEPDQRRGQFRGKARHDCHGAGGDHGRHAGLKNRHPDRFSVKSEQRGAGKGRKRR